MTRPRVSVYQSPIGWAVEVWVGDKVVHSEHRASRPTFREKLEFVADYGVRSLQACALCKAPMRHAAGTYRGRALCCECLDVATEPCDRGWRNNT
jgi:hypothetical protein